LFIVGLQSLFVAALLFNGGGAGRPKSPLKEARSA